MASNVVDNAKEAASNVMDSARETAGNVAEGAGRVINSASTTARETGSNLMEVIQRNPVPAAMACFGLSWLWWHWPRKDGQSNWYNGSRRRDNYPWSEYQPSYRSSDTVTMGGSATSGSSLGESLDQAKDRVGETFDQAKQRVAAKADQVQQRVSQMGENVQYQASLAADSLQQWIDQNPLAAGAVAIALGAAVGMAVPETPQEQRWLGEMRDRVVDKAQQTAQEVGQKVQAVAKEAIGTVREQAQTQGLTG